MLAPGGSYGTNVPSTRGAPSLARGSIGPGGFRGRLRGRGRGLEFGGQLGMLT